MIVNNGFTGPKQTCKTPAFLLNARLVPVLFSCMFRVFWRWCGSCSFTEGGLVKTFTTGLSVGWTEENIREIKD